MKQRTRKPARRIELAITDRGRPRTDRTFVRRVVAAVLAFVEREDLAVSLLLTNDEEIAELHGRHLDDPTPTDVMSFADEGEADVVVSVETARRVARERGHAPRAEIALYIVHGILHACGHDDVRAADRRRMRRAERDVLQRLGLQVARVDE
jgi:probable rRNA maturation factor